MLKTWNATKFFKKGEIILKGLLKNTTKHCFWKGFLIIQIPEHIWKEWENSGFIEYIGTGGI